MRPDPALKLNLTPFLVDRKRACIEQSRGTTTTTTTPHYYYQSNNNTNNVLEIKVRIRPWWISRDESSMSVFFYVPIFHNNSVTEIQEVRLPAELDDGSTELCNILDPDAASKVFDSGDFCSNMTVWKGATMENVYRNGCFLFVVKDSSSSENRTIFFIPPGLLQIPYFLRDEIWESASLLYGYMEASLSLYLV
jgi:hypothetical protein